MRSPKKAPPPAIDDLTMLKLLNVSLDLACLKPWDYLFDSNLIGLPDAQSDSFRLASVMGNAGQVFGVGIYRNAGGVRWIMDMVNDPQEAMNPDAVAEIDALKFEMLFKREMHKEDLVRLIRLGYKPVRKGAVWPQFQSVSPGRLPWFINQAEAEQLLFDLTRLVQFCKLIKTHPNLLEEHHPDIPFLPKRLIDRPLLLADLEWQPLIIAPEKEAPFQPTAEQMKQLLVLKREPHVAYEYGCSLLMGGSVVEQGRPCYSRVNMLVHAETGLILGSELDLATVPYGVSAGNGLVKTLECCGNLPDTLCVGNDRLYALFSKLAHDLQIDLIQEEDMHCLNEAMDSLEDHINSRGMF